MCPSASSKLIWILLNYLSDSIHLKHTNTQQIETNNVHASTSTDPVIHCVSSWPAELQILPILCAFYWSTHFWISALICAFLCSALPLSCAYGASALLSSLHCTSRHILILCNIPVPSDISAHLPCTPCNLCLLPLSCCTTFLTVSPFYPCS